MIDLISDTVTMPSKEMLTSILSAKLGDAGRLDQNGRGEDKETNALEDYAAKLLGKESALFFPTGTMANTAGILAHAKPGDTVLVEERQHIYITEKICFEETGFRMKPAFYKLKDDGSLSIKEIEELINREDPSLICLENTHNFSGGKVIPVENMREVYELCHSKSIPVHMDGARLFNAAAALGVGAEEIASYTDSLMFCVSKGLGAPIGSILLGSKAFINRALEFRKLLGGTMRQSGVAAACGMFALTHNIPNLSLDNRNASIFASKLGSLKRIKADTEPMSNIVLFDLKESGIRADEFCKRLIEKGVRLSEVFTYEARAVFHEGITEEDAVKAAETIKAFDMAL